MDSDTTKRDRSGKSPTKFMERPDNRKKEQNPDDGGITSEDVDALEDQEQDLGDAPQKEGWPQDPAKPRENPKPDPRKTPDTERKDESSGDAGDCAC